MELEDSAVSELRPAVTTFTCRGTSIVDEAPQILQRVTDGRKM
jgi:hypothetical protein